MQGLSRLSGRWMLAAVAVVSIVVVAVINRPGVLNSAVDGAFGWSQQADLPLRRTESQGLAIGDKLYVFGGFFSDQYEATTEVSVYDAASDTWTALAPMPEAITHAAQTVDGEIVYLLGGYLGDAPGPSVDTVLKYNLRTNTWSYGPPLPAARGGGTAAIVGRSLHFFGGAVRLDVDDDTDMPEHYILDLDSGIWRSGPPLPGPRNHLGSAVIDREIYVIGGQLGPDEATTSQARMDVYNPASGIWRRAADLPVGRSHISAAVLAIDGALVVLGGATNGPRGVASRDVFVYDVAGDVWARMEDLPGGRKSLIAGYIGDRLIVSAGGTGSPSVTTWAAWLPNTWESAPAAPTALGEVVSAIIDDTLYLVGEGSSVTLAYDLGRRQWRSNAAVRPFPGNHHAAEVYNGKWYLFGGFGGDSRGKVQIYDPAQDSWAIGPDMPFAAGSSATALIGGKIYVAGGIVGSSTTTQAAVYDPLLNTWSPIAAMPQGRNHAAAATDGQKLYVFGGRGPGSGDDNVVANGFDTLQIYDPASNTWQSSDDPTSSLRPLPIGRGGMGKAVYRDGSFYIFGGETASGPGATADRVYDRVDVYDPAANSWSTAAPMPTARHGIFPVQIGWRVYVAGGGTRAGFSQSNVLEVYNLPVDDQPPSPVDPSATPTQTGTPTHTPTASSTPVAGATPTMTATATTVATPTGTPQPAPNSPLYIPLLDSPRP